MWADTSPMYDVFRHTFMSRRISMHHYTHIMLFTSPLMRTQSSVSDTVGFPYSQLVKLTVEWSLQSNSPSVFPSFSPIQSSSLDAIDMGHRRVVYAFYIVIDHYWFKSWLFENIGLSAYPWPPHLPYPSWEMTKLWSSTLRMLTKSPRSLRHSLCASDHVCKERWRWKQWPL